MSFGIIASSYVRPQAWAWRSGALGYGVDNGTFETWRGTYVGLASAWGDYNTANQLSAWALDPGGPYANWARDMDYSIGAIWKAEGMTWANAASGAYDTQWTNALISVRDKWYRIKRGHLFLRFAYDMNGNWQPWWVADSEVNDFKTSWIRFYNLQRSIIPAASLVFGVHGNTVGPTYDWRTLWPGDQYVDLFEVLWNAQHWNLQGSTPTDPYGGPQALALHQDFARLHGKSMAIHWCTRNDLVGDNPAYIDYMKNFFDAQKGYAPGCVVYESYYNNDASPFAQIYPDTTTQLPLSAARYKQLF